MSAKGAAAYLTENYADVAWCRCADVAVEPGSGEEGGGDRQAGGGPLRKWHSFTMRSSEWWRGQVSLCLFLWFIEYKEVLRLVERAGDSLCFLWLT